jgi:uncharacterized protein
VTGHRRDAPVRHAGGVAGGRRRCCSRVLLIVEASGGGVVAIEVKLATVVEDRDVRHLHWLGERLGDRLLDKVVVHVGPQAYRRADGVAVVPLALIGP